MRIKSIELTNIRCFEHIKVEFGRDGEITPWTVILGDNGTGKSTLLRCIALALAPEIELVTMMQSNSLWVRDRELVGEISISVTEGTHLLSRTFTIHSTRNGEMIREIFLNGKRPSNNPDSDTIKITDFLHNEIFISGYGASRRISGDKNSYC